MTEQNRETADLSRSCWLISDGKAGHESIGRGIAEALGRSPMIKRVDPRGLQQRLAPFWPIASRDRLDAPGSPFASPVPDLVLAIGRQTAPYLRALKRAAPTTFTVSLLNAKAGRGVADVIWTPLHDRLAGDNVVVTLTSPHRFSGEALASLRHSPLPEIAALPSPRVSVLLGGPSKSVAFDADDVARFAALFSGFVKTVGQSGLFDSGKPPSYLITPSRRTPNALMDHARAATDHLSRLVYAGGEPNPYGSYLALADALIVTGDSISMISEAVATGRPVFVFRPSHLKSKFVRFLDALEAAGAIRTLTDDAASIARWDYPPIDPTPDIARQIHERWARHRARFAVPMSARP